MAYLRDFKNLLKQSFPQLQQKFMKEVLRQVRTRGKEVLAVEPKSAYLPLFVLDRAKKLSGVVGPDGCGTTTPETIEIIGAEAYTELTLV